MPKYFFMPGSSDITQGTQGVICGETAHHMQNVLRMQPGDNAILCDGNGTDYTAVLVEFDKKAKPPSAVFEVTGSYPCETEPRTKITLYQAMPKGDKMELVIQKCVEIGVAAIVPVITSRTIARAKEFEKKTLRYRRIAESAAGQSMRGIVPNVCEAISFKDALEMCAAELTLVAYEEEKAVALKSVLESKKVLIPRQKFAQQTFATPLKRGIETPSLTNDLIGVSIDSVDIWIGPEGGFAKEEIQALKNRGATPVSLGARILRTETAAITAVAQVICLLE